MSRIGVWSEDSQTITPYEKQPKRVVVTAVKVYDIEDIISWVDDMDDPDTLAEEGGKMIDVADLISIVLDWAHDDLPEVTPNMELEF
jgi:predicted cation transporter